MKMIENSQCLDRESHRYFPVLYHDEIITITLLSAGSEIGRPGKNFGCWQVEIDHHELVMQIDALASAPLASERLGGIRRQIGKITRPVEPSGFRTCNFPDLSEIP